MNCEYVSCGEKRRAEHEKTENKAHLLRALASLSGAGLGAEPKKSASSAAAPIAREITEDSESTALASGSENEKKVESENALLGSPLSDVRLSLCCWFWGMHRIRYNVVKTVDRTPQRKRVFCAECGVFFSLPQHSSSHSLTSPSNSPTSNFSLSNLPQPQPLFHLHKPQVQPARIRSHQHHGQRRQQALGEDGNHRRCRDVARE